jgi:hypothetical protein
MRRPLERDGAASENVDPISNLQDCTHLLLGDDKGHVGVASKMVKMSKHFPG